MLPLSFSEFLYFNGFSLQKSKSPLGSSRLQALDENGERYELREVFGAYMRLGGMPGIAEAGLDQEKALVLLDGIYSTVVMRDILEREKRRGQKNITDPALLRKIILFLAANIGSSVSVSSIGRTLVSEGLLEGEKRRGAPSVHTVQAYVDALLESYFFYEIKRFDIKGKEYLRTLGKYYIVDIGLRNYLLGFRERDSGHALENVVYFELPVSYTHLDVYKRQDLHLRRLRHVTEGVEVSEREVWRKAQALQMQEPRVGRDEQVAGLRAQALRGELCRRDYVAAFHASRLPCSARASSPASSSMRSAPRERLTSPSAWK